jgi:hypothetical protein
MVQGPGWVNRVNPTMGRSLPVFPNEQTFSECGGMSQRCQFLPPARPPATLLRRVVPAPQRCATHFLWP